MGIMPQSCGMAEGPWSQTAEAWLPAMPLPLLWPCLSFLVPEVAPHLCGASLWYPVHGCWEDSVCASCTHNVHMLCARVHGYGRACANLWLSKPECWWFLLR